jgi:murein DD-endopeptidase MepM/ murein hydrolase activator NlpD
LLALTLVTVKSADSSNRFQIDNRLVLEKLKREIAAAAAQSLPQAPPGSEPLDTAPPAAEFRDVQEVVRAGDTLGGILRRVGVSPSEVTRWSETSRRHVSLGRLQPGHRFTFLVPSGTDRLAGLQYELTPESTLVMREDGDDITAQVERLPRMVDVRVVGGTIESSLYAAAMRRGVPDSVISAMVDVFGWDIDFSSDLQAGDTFRVVYEEQRDVDGKIQGGQVLAAEIVIGSRRWTAVYFEADDDGGNYYTPEGRAFGRSFLRYPLEFTRITSQFTSSRFHPLLGVNRPHLGVDFAAPMGTPVRAIASGRVEYAGWKGGSGRHIKIDHGDGVESCYSHLQAITSGVRVGSRVQVGQMIGRVGASGLATGPHLHFALWRNGVYVNPMTAKLTVASPPLAARYVREFSQVRDDVMRQLTSAPSDQRVASATESPSRN